MPYGIARCYPTPGRGDIPASPPAELDLATPEECRTELTYRMTSSCRRWLIVVVDDDDDDDVAADCRARRDHAFRFSELAFSLQFFSTKNVETSSRQSGQCFEVNRAPSK